MLPPLVAEAIGTFVFLLIILTVLFRKQDAIPSHAAPVLIGVGLLVSIVVASGLSGSGHLNPVVSLVMGLNGQISMMEVAHHVIAQIVGGVAAFMVFQQL